MKFLQFAIAEKIRFATAATLSSSLAEGQIDALRAQQGMLPLL